MVDRKFILIAGLLILTGIACSLFSRTPQALTPAQKSEQTLISLNDALTLAFQTLQAESPITDLRILGEHHVAAGETLECIGRGYGVPPEAIAVFNHINPASTLKTGKVLEIPAIAWTNVSSGQVCPPQFDITDWASNLNKYSQPNNIQTTKTQQTPTFQVFDEPTKTPQVIDKPTKTLRVFDKPTVTENPAIQHPPGGGTGKLPIPTFADTPIPITLPPLPICFPPPCLPTFPPFP